MTRSGGKQPGRAIGDFVDVSSGEATGGEVVAGEGGEPLPANTPDVEPGSDSGGDSSNDAANAWGADDDSSYNTNDTESSATGTGSLNLEVTLLSLDAADRVAAGIAGMAAAAVRRENLKGVVLADPDLVGALRLRATLASEIAMIEARVAAARAATPVETESAGFVAPAAAVFALQGVKRAAHSVASALSVFSVKSSYSGRKNVVHTSALIAALAKHLAFQGIDAQVPRYAVVGAVGSGLIDRALAVQLKCREANLAGTAGPEIEAAAQMIDLMLQALLGSPAGDPMAPRPDARLVAGLVQADMAADAIADGFGVLTVELAASGGSYRAKKWILNALFGSDGLTYSGGAAATFFLLAGDRMTALASDTLYFASGHGKFRKQTTKFSASNIADPVSSPARR